MFENIAKFFKKLVKTEAKEAPSKNAAKERLHLVLMQDRANVSADFLELMKQEIIEVIKKYIEVEEAAIDVRLTNEVGEDGTKGAPSLYANIPIVNIKNGIKNENADNKKEDKEQKVDEDKKEEKTNKEQKVEEKNDVQEQKLEDNEEIKEEPKGNKENQEEVKSIEEQKNEENKTEIKENN